MNAFFRSEEDEDEEEDIFAARSSIKVHTFTTDESAILRRLLHERDINAHYKTIVPIYATNIKRAKDVLN